MIDICCIPCKLYSSAYTDKQITCLHWTEIRLVVSREHLDGCTQLGVQFSKGKHYIDWSDLHLFLITNDI